MSPTPLRAGLQLKQRAALPYPPGASTDHDPLPPQGLSSGQTLVQELPQTPSPEQPALSIHDQRCSASGCPYRCSWPLACMFNYLPHQRCLCDQPANLSLADEHADRRNRQRTLAVPADNAAIGKFAAHAASLGFRSADARTVDATSGALKTTVYACESSVTRLLPPVSSLSHR